jgi:hypothetical protein
VGVCVGVWGGGQEISLQHLGIQHVTVLSIKLQNSIKISVKNCFHISSYCRLYLSIFSDMSVLSRSIRYCQLAVRDVMIVLKENIIAAFINSD